ncbi:hypothetical protein M0813_18681 [Anaeramoeba flamelloides]|uniref:Uncharacterized protein n=1 Tax=Anaeramoeba flamelloides TaxID=1746091 RepID=A0ABQ8YRC6_9EUKA|nr:hypothetical protein M0813_18681 [Anaeramoeba flamelloides]
MEKLSETEKEDKEDRNENNNDERVIESETKKENEKGENSEQETEKEKDKEKENDMETEKNQNDDKNQNEQQDNSKVELNIKTQKVVNEQKSRTIDETHLDIADGIEEIMEIFQNIETKQESTGRIKVLLDKILDIQKTSFFEKHKTCKILSYELLDERKKNKSRYSKLESQMVMILENLQSEKKIKRNLLSLNHKLKKNILSLRKTITNFQKLLKPDQNLNKEEEQEKDKNKETEIEMGKEIVTNTNTDNEENQLNLINQKEFSNISFVNSLASQLMIV